MNKFIPKQVLKKILKVWNHFWGLLGVIAFLIGLILGSMNLYEKLFIPKTNILPDPLPIEYIFGSQNYYVQALTNTQNKVIAYAVTTRDENFNPIITILQNAGYTKDGINKMATTNIKLGKDTFSSLNRDPDNIYLDKPDNIFATVGARRFYYQEEYYFGNPGNYQSYFFVINDGGLENYDSLPSAMFDFDNKKLDPSDPEIVEFRNNSVFNTFQITSPGEGWNNKELRKYMAGPDYDQMRVIPESVLNSKYSKEEQLKNINKLSTEVDIQVFIDLLGKPIVVNSEPTVFLRDGDKTVSERFDEEYSNTKK
ncbi:hypothetical protein KKG24_01840 [Patescibacteria group bacterium]|nr:hypothetical protein [Patescibacteria group bacterium]